MGLDIPELPMDWTARETAIVREQEEAEGRAIAEALAELRAAAEALQDAKASAEEGLALVVSAQEKLAPTPVAVPESFPLPIGVLRAEAMAYAESVHRPGRMFGGAA